MQRLLSSILALVLLGSLALPVSTQNVADRLLVIVNREVITESEVLWALALDADLQPLNLSRENRRTMLERLIDQKLLLQEALKVPRNEPTEEEISKYINDEFVSKFGGESQMRTRLQKVGLEQSALREIARQRLEILRYIDFRFRSFIFIKPEEIEQYYRENLIPDAARRGLGAPQLDDELRSKIEGVLIDQRVNSELDRFFDEVRAQAQVTRLAQL